VSGGAGLRAGTDLLRHPRMAWIYGMHPRMAWIYWNASMRGVDAVLTG